MSEQSDTSPQPISYQWLAASGFHKLERLQRQPTDHYRRCIATECIGESFMVSSEDLCIEVAPNRIPADHWLVWLTRASAQNSRASIWLGVRRVTHAREIVLLYEGLTGRQFGQPSCHDSELKPPVFDLMDRVAKPKRPRSKPETLGDRVEAAMRSAEVRQVSVGELSKMLGVKNHSVRTAVRRHRGLQASGFLVSLK
jgi:hypothetical protein